MTHINFINNFKVDFFKFKCRYACGRWPENHPTPDTNMMNSWFSERSDKVTWRVRELLRKNLTDAPWAVSQAKILYKSCINLGKFLFF